MFFIIKSYCILQGGSTSFVVTQTWIFHKFAEAFTMCPAPPPAGCLRLFGPRNHPFRLPDDPFRTNRMEWIALSHLGKKTKQTYITWHYIALHTLHSLNTLPKQTKQKKQTNKQTLPYITLHYIHYINSNIQAYKHARMHTLISYKHTNIHARMHTLISYKHTNKHACIYLYIYYNFIQTYKHTCILTYLHTYIHT